MRKVLVAVLTVVSILTNPLLAQEHADPAWARKASPKRPSAKVNSVPPMATPQTVLTAPERALQLLDRFTFGPRPGDLDRVLSMGTDKWFEQQLNPDTIKDAALEKRLSDFPTLNMTPEQALILFPDRGMIQQAADGKRPTPTDALLAAMYEVQVAKLKQQADGRRIYAHGLLPAEPSDAESAAVKQEGQFKAARIAGELFALPKNRRMATLIQMPVEDRIAFTAYVAACKLLTVCLSNVALGQS